MFLLLRVAAGESHSNCQKCTTTQLFEQFTQSKQKFFFKCMKFKCSENWKSSPIYFVVQRTTSVSPITTSQSHSTCQVSKHWKSHLQRGGGRLCQGGSRREQHATRWPIKTHLSLYKTTLKMQINDVVSMQIYYLSTNGVVLYANERAPHFTQFMGSMLQEDFSYSQWWSSGK